MPIGYLATVALLGCCTLVALAPLRRPRALGTASFWLGFVLNELPFLGLLYLLGSTLLAIEEGDVDSAGGRVVAGLAVLTAGGLAVVARRAFRSRAATERALQEGLGAVHPLGRLPIGRILFMPFPVRPRSVERVPNVAYGDAGGRNLFDLYRRRSPPPDGPTLIHLHGGRFVRGRKNRQALPLLHGLASRGWVCVSANYRLGPEVSFPDDLIDVKRVIAWVREHGHEYGADADTIVVAGSSAGGHLAAMTALTTGDPALQPGFEHVDTSVAAAVALGAYFGPRGGGRRRPSSPLAAVRPDAPPFLVAHGDRDSVVFVEHARDFAERLRSVSTNPVVYLELPGGQHAFDLLHSVRFESVVDAVAAFVDRLKRR